jgi:hypothetical protein
VPRSSHGTKIQIIIIIIILTAVKTSIFPSSVIFKRDENRFSWTRSSTYNGCYLNTIVQFYCFLTQSKVVFTVHASRLDETFLWRIPPTTYLDESIILKLLGVRSEHWLPLNCIKPCVQSVHPSVGYSFTHNGLVIRRSRDLRQCAPFPPDFATYSIRSVQWARWRWRHTTDIQGLVIKTADKFNGQSALRSLLCVSNAVVPLSHTNALMTQPHCVRAHGRVHKATEQHIRFI